ncbi:MAG: hypothetical protein M3Y20_04550, partial [Actinomycetota bacterium]|nr:hypothetical protein [Actinomycetota bacterium]
AVDPAATRAALDEQRRSNSTPRRSKDRLGLRALGLTLALLATTATSQTPDPESRVLDVTIVDAVFYARVTLHPQDEQLWVRSADDGGTWEITERPDPMPKVRVTTITIEDPELPTERISEKCARGGQCWRTRSLFHPDTGGWWFGLERSDGEEWVEELKIPTEPESFMIDPVDGSRVIVVDRRSVQLRVADGRWTSVDLVDAVASLPRPSPSTSSGPGGG